MPKKCCTDMENSFINYINLYYGSLLNELNTKLKELKKLDEDLQSLDSITINEEEDDEN